MATRQMPQNLDAEMAVLGSCFIKPEIIDKVCDQIKVDMFFNEKNQIIFDAIVNLHDNAVALDVTTISDKLERKKQLNKAGGVEYISEIIDSVASSANIDYYINIVRDKAIRRNLIDTATNIISNAYEEEAELNELLDDSDRLMTNVISNRRTSDFKPITDVIRNTQEKLERLAQNKSDITGVPSGFNNLDKITSGFQENELIILAARPGVGKTAFALNIASYVSLNTDKPVAFFSMEMSAEQLVSRMISSLGGVDQFKLRTGRLEHNDWKKVNEAMSQLGDANLFLEDIAGLTVSEIRAKCRKLSNMEKGIGLVIIDYLQLIQGSAKYAGNRVQEVTEISRGLKKLAMELHVPVIALAQLSRNLEHRENKKPNLSDLRESGSIEQDADIVSFLYREDYYSELNEVNSPTDLLVAKNRSGSTGQIKLLFEKNILNFIAVKEGAENDYED